MASPPAASEHSPAEPALTRPESPSRPDAPRVRLAALIGEAPRRPVRWSRALPLAAAALLAGAAVSLARQPGAGALDTIWAEDGYTFLSDATRHGVIDSLTTPYAGYMHLVPRLLAVLAAAAPPQAAAAVLAVGAALCTAAVALLVYVASAGHFASQAARLLAAAIVVVVPVGHDELPNSIANLHWMGLYALFWMLLWTPRGRAGRIVAVGVVFLAVASDILSLVFLPLALLRLYLRRDRHSAILAGTLNVAFAVQVAGFLIASSSRALAPDPVAAVSGYLVRAVPSALLGQVWLGVDVDTRWLVLAGAAWLLVAAALLAAWRLGGRRPDPVLRPSWPLAIAAILHGAALSALPVFLSGLAPARYAAAPAMLLVAALVALLQPAGPGMVSATPLAAFIALMLVVCAVNLRPTNPRAQGPLWSNELRAARVACAAGRPTDPAASTVDIPLPPRVGGWRATVPCRWVLR